MLPRYADFRTHLLGVVAAVRRACDPFELVRRANPPETNWGVLSIGKAAPAMDAACGSMLSRRLVITTEGTELWGSPDNAEIVDHPLPTERNLRAAERVLRWLEPVRRAVLGDDSLWHLDRTDPAGVRDALEGKDRASIPLLLMLSGGASACLSAPVLELTIEDLRRVTSALLRAGCPIDELNIVRKHLESLKGGRLAAHVAPVPVQAFILSDVVSGDLSSIGSGPVSPDPSTFSEALSILKAYDVADQCARVCEYLAEGSRGAHAETIKPGDPRLSNVTIRVIGDWTHAVGAAAAHLSHAGFEVATTDTAFAGEPADVARRIVDHARSLRERARQPLALVMGGETSVRVGGATGVGGRSQELALAVALGIARIERTAFLSFATDGVDGPTDAAGAIVTGTTASDAQTRSIDLDASLQNHDAHTALEDLGCLVRTGPTGTNVNDVAVLVVY